MSDPRNSGVRCASILCAAVALLVLGHAPAEARWPADPARPLALTDADTNTGVIDACADSAGGAFVAWGHGQVGLVTQLRHLDAFGDDRFPSGAFVPDTTLGTLLHIASDGASGVYVTSFAYAPASGSVGSLLLSHLSDRGTRLWTVRVATLTRSGAANWTDMRAVSADAGVLVVWLDAATSPTRLLAQRLGRSGDALWPAGGVPVVAASAAVTGFKLSVDDDGGSWFAFDIATSPIELRVQRVSPAGVVRWPGSGTLVATSVEPYDLLSDGSGGLFLSYRANGVKVDRLQRVRSDGSLAFGPTGKASPGGAGLDSVNPVFGARANVVVDVAAQVGSSSLLHYETRVQRIDTTGTILWSGSGVNAGSAPSPSSGVTIRGDGANAIVTLQPFSDIPGAWRAVQRVSAAGALLWPQPKPVFIVNDGVLTLYDLDTPGRDVLASDGSVFYFTTIADSGMGLVKSAYRVRAQHLDANGRSGDTMPRILSVTDVPGDIGGALEVRWQASPLEGDATMATIAYDVLRADRNASGGIVWTLVASRPADGSNAYAMPVPTLTDSTGPASPATVVRVQSRDAASRTWWSPPDSARSIANSPPLAVGTDHGVAFALDSPTPSPASSTVLLRYGLPQRAEVRLELFDTTGRRVGTLSHGDRAAGWHTESVSLARASGARVGAGIYFIRLAALGQTRVRRLVVLH